jgi:hypothetical protein
VFIISFDQGGGEVLRNQSIRIPTFKRMFNEGAATWRASTIVPSITLPSHTSMLTGVKYETHGITWNDYQPAKGVVQVPTVFSLAKEQGLTTAMYVGKEKFKHLIIPGTVDTFYWGDTSTDVATQFASEVATKKPNVCFIHFPEIDQIGHSTYVGSPQQIQAIATCDAALQIIRDAVRNAGIENESIFILTADHGAHNEGTGNNGHGSGTHGNAERSDVDIPWVVWGTAVKPGCVLPNYTLMTYDTTATALWALGVPVPASLDGTPVTEAFKPLPESVSESQIQTLTLSSRNTAVTSQVMDEETTGQELTENIGEASLPASVADTVVADADKSNLSAGEEDPLESGLLNLLCLIAQAQLDRADAAALGGTSDEELESLLGIIQEELSKLLQLVRDNNGDSGK